MCLQRGLSVRVIDIKGSTSAPYPLYANFRSLSYPFEVPPNPPKIKPTVGRTCDPPGGGRPTPPGGVFCPPPPAPLLPAGGGVVITTYCRFFRRPTVDPFLPPCEGLLLSQLFFPLSTHRSYPSFEAIRLRYEEPQQGEFFGLRERSTLSVDKLQISLHSSSPLSDSSSQKGSVGRSA